MRTNHFPSTIPGKSTKGPPWFIALPGILCLTVAAGCNRSQSPESDLVAFYPYQFEVTGEDFLISALDELNSIADWAQSNSPAGLPPRERRLVLSKTATDTVYVYGQVIDGGYGAVVTERHGYPKGLLLITVRKSYGKEDGRIVTDTRRYISFESFDDDEPQQSNLTELYGLSQDTIVTRVLRNGILETYTFRLPVITRTVGVDGTIRVTERYGFDGAIVSEVTDGSGALVQLRRNNGLATGALVARTEYPDSTWRNILTVGQADGSVYREITSGP